MPGLRSLRNRLALIFALIILGAIGTIYLSVTPRLEASLRSQRLNDVISAARTYTPLAGEAMWPQRPLPKIEGDNPDEQKIRRFRVDKVRSLAERTNKEILIVGFDDGPTAYADTLLDGGATATDVAALAHRALDEDGLVSGIITTPNGEQAVAAQPIHDDRAQRRREPQWIAVFADSLDEVADNVSLIRRQVLLAGGIALVIAILAGYLVARALAARVKRLERAARKVAAGDFSQPIKADSDDELGQLARTFNEMQDQLARLDRARKQFIASASHELRTPIFSLGGFLELLADEDLDEDTRRAFLEQIRGQVDRMRNLAVELLDLSRLEAGALELRPEPTDVGQLAREVAAEFTPAAVRHESDVELDLYREPIELECDPERVAQVLRILLDNALRHTPPGTGVRVSATRSNGHVRLEVADQGPGIARQNMPHIFEPFFTSNEQAQGAGLGLAIARELAERMQGRLTVRSNPGKTIFSLDLPA